MKPPRPAPGRKTVVGHRGSPTHAPENTLRSYQLALELGADAVEQDLQVTRDNVLVCLHDRTLERTTNVHEVYPGRAREGVENGRMTRHWFVHDLLLDEIRQLDAGSWFGDQFARSRIPTFHEVLEWVGDRATLLAELKDPEVYETFGVDPLALFAAALRRHGVHAARSGEPLVTMQSFHEPTVRRAAAVFERRIPRVLLVDPADAPRWSGRDSVQRVARFATGIGPGKELVETQPALVTWAHEAGLRVTPWTFRARSPGRFATVRAEMAYYLSALDVDAVITDDPDQSPYAETPNGS